MFILRVIQQQSYTWNSPLKNTRTHQPDWLICLEKGLVHVVYFISQVDQDVSGPCTAFHYTQHTPEKVLVWH